MLPNKWQQEIDRVAMREDLAGTDEAGAAERHVAGKCEGYAPQLARYRELLRGQDTQRPVRVALYFPAPHSYTGEDVLELQAHGGPVVLQLLLARCLQAATEIDATTGLPRLPGLPRTTSRTSRAGLVASALASLAMTPAKEAHYFDDEGEDWGDPGYERYHAMFPDWDGRPRGEVTPSYIYWPGCLERIAAYNPGMKLVFIFRDPVERAWSQWKMEFARGWETEPFAWAIREGRQCARSVDEYLMGTSSLPR